MRAVLVFALVVVPTIASAQTPALPAATLDALLACERAEHAAWAHSMRVLDERYTLGTHAQCVTAGRVVDTATRACTAAATALAPGHAELAQGLRECVRVRETAKTDSLSGNANVSDLLEAMRDVCALDALRELDGDVRSHSLTLPAARAAELHRIVLARHLRSAYAQLQAQINAANSDRYQYEVELRDLRHEGTPAERRTATTGRNAAQSTMTRLRAARGRLAAAMDRWRRSGTPAPVLAAVTGALDAEDVAGLRRDLAE